MTDSSPFPATDLTNTENTDLTHLFVYGTLTQGLGLSDRLANATFLGHGLTQGRLYDLGSFPGFKAADHAQEVVYGELYQVDAETLRTLDGIEGYDPNQIDDSMYIREMIPVVSFQDGRTVHAQVYVYQKNITPQHQIPHGDYRRYLQEREDGLHWYIAYGSNMSSERLLDRISTVYDNQVGFLDGYQLVFNKKNPRWGTAANLRYRGQGYRCPFVAYALDREDLHQLDSFEGEPSHYVRLGLPFTTSSGKRSLGHIYLAHPQRLVAESPPLAEYLGYLYHGYQEHDFDPIFDPFTTGNG
ncbi:gamma-glutamylcyclotransferase [Candidatus Synechococcus calcipolaris G9]|uniref:Gamma-glutamylcyclotransferase family protein n=1 Tax=Candidatus Synechococcus calcipolaris G9 TaxID=1497997 RepID=A0ABT6EXI0_9SYNE|nr:gamma-glutamylcyclotransferase [Candidatus Synechococcus calcipolaris]MDG2990491.1 gamma-glutamylcyclotransferase [Candidatus Synechococcus calcipolaris G9]